MTVQTLPPVAREYQAAQRREIRAALAAVRRRWGRVDPGAIALSWARELPVVLAVLTAAQEVVAGPAEAYMAAVLAATGQVADPVAAPRPRALVGVASDGSPLQDALGGYPVYARRLIGEGVPARQAVQQAGRALQSGAMTLLSDTGRQSEVVSMVARPEVTGWVRVLEGASCSRCLILAGKRFRWNQGFQRHPRCDCRHIPAAESVAGDLAADPKAAFDAMSADEQDRIFTEAGATAIREGADMSRVVNVRQGMRTAQLYGRKVSVTTVGTSRRAGWRGGARLMPESILKVAGDDRAEAVRLLKLHGYFL